MQTHLAPQFEGTQQGQQAQAVLRNCVHCGFCNATCPTYRVTGDELDSPRGRIYLMKQVFEGHTPTRTTQAHLDRCIGCRHCESTCPSGVQYHELLEVGQQVVDQQVQRPWPQRWRRWVLRTVVPTRAFGPLLAVGRALRPLMPSALAQHVPAAARHGSTIWPDAARTQTHARHVLMPEGCVQPHLRPGIDAATARVLDAVGVGVVRVRGGGCCGALKGHLGDQEGARAQARANIDAWWPRVQGPKPVEAILVNASGCGAWVKDYASLLADDPAYADKARQVVALLKDPADLLPQWVPLLQKRLAGARLSGPVAFHPPCSFSHVLKHSGAGRPGPVETGLRALGFEVRLAAVDSHQCCGAGGAYSMLQPELAQPLREAKAAALTATGGVAVASANIGCITHLQSALAMPVKHWVEVLDEALRDQSPPVR